MSSDSQVVTSVADGRSAQLIQIESSKLLPTLIICSMLAVAGLMTALFAWFIAKDARMESRLLQYYVQDLRNEVIAAGVEFESFDSYASKR